MASRFRLLRSNIATLPRTTDDFITSIAILNNYLLHEEPQSVVSNLNQELTTSSGRGNPYWDPLPENPNLSIKDSPAAIHQREVLRHYFMTPEGEVSWQYDYINRGRHGEDTHESLYL